MGLTWYVKDEFIFKPAEILVVLMYCFSFGAVWGSEEWFVVWLGLEMNMLSFLYFIGVYSKESSEVVGKYYFVQSLGSGCLLGMLYLGWNDFIWLLVMMFKGGLGLFYYWYVGLVSKLSWGMIFVMSVFQSILPLYLVSEVGMWMVLLMGMVGVVAGVVGVFGQLGLRVVVGYSSVHHGGWVMMVMGVDSVMWSLYLFVYGVMMLCVVFMMSHSSLNQLGGSGERLGIGVLSGVLSLGGVPPFIGFYLSWMAISVLVGFDLFVAVLGVAMSVGMLYVYVRLMYSLIMGDMVAKWFSQGSWAILVEIVMASTVGVYLLYS